MESLAELFRRAIHNQRTGTVDAGKVARAAVGIAAAMDAYASDHSRELLTHVVVPWALQIAKQAPAKWILPATVPPACMMELGPHVCGSFAVGGCHICGRPICINHALIAGDATLVCWACMRLASQHAKPWEPPAPGPSAPASGSSLHWAYELLGVEEAATDAEVKKAYKKRIASLHPDKNSEQEAHGDVVRLVTKAYESIKASRGM